MKTELLYLAHNRLEFTRASFETLIANTSWENVRRIYVLDDNSTDGTRSWLKRRLEQWWDERGAVAEPVDYVFYSGRFGGPVAAMNYALPFCRSPLLCKVDNDTVVSPGWLDELLAVMAASPELSVLGFEPGFGDPVGSDVTYGWKPASHVGGLCLMRTRIFRQRRPRPAGWFGGWTEFQRVGGFQCGWITPDLQSFLLDHLPVEPWRSLAAAYVERGWARPWPPYPEEMSGYWDWWLQQQAVVAA